MTTANLTWTGVYPAATTQFASDMSVDIESTKRVQEALLDDGVDGIVVLGTVGENNSLEPEEKRAVLKAAVETAEGRAPVITGVSELTTARAIQFAKDAEALGVDALMVLPAMVYTPSAEELQAHLRAVAEATGLPVMLYNNPPAYRVSLSVADLEALSDVDNIVAVKESAPDSRRFTDIFNACGDRYKILAGLDDVALEGLLLGASGWVSGLTNAFPEESVALVEAVRTGDLDRARKIYRWFLPLLHLDADPDLVQCIKLAEQVMGRGSERVRMPRMPLTGARRKQVIDMVNDAAANRPEGPKTMAKAI